MPSSQNRFSGRKRRIRSLRKPSMEKDVTHIIPALSLTDVVVFPFSLCPLVVEGESASKTAELAADGNRLIALFPILPQPSTTASGGQESVAPTGSLHEINVDIQSFSMEKQPHSKTGVIARIVKKLRFPDGTLRILVRGLKRVEFIEFADEKNHLVKVAERTDSAPGNDLESIALARNAFNQFQKVINSSPAFPEELRIAVLNLNDHIRMIDLIADSINISFPEKLAILTLTSPQERLQLLTILLNRELEVIELGTAIQSQVHDALSKSQKEYFLREQLRTIRQELGEDMRNPDVVNLESRMKELHLPEHVEKTVRRELDRLNMMHPAAGEYQMIHTYIDWLLTVPWNQFTEERIDVIEAKRVLDADHHDLKEVKERILEFLAVLQLKNDRKAPVICFVGPPGVGKTSLGKSIASATGRAFVRMSLGGIKDEAEIRGHRRTYLGALPGRIIQGMKKAGSLNPVFMLDEIDKVGNDFRGDPASALLEVLDPQQNRAFNDHYLELDYDLSNVMFIVTANILDTIPPALLDRMEIIRIPGYTPLEKKEIARRFLIPRQLLENGLKKGQLTFPSATIDHLIAGYTREAGVRNLERTIGTLCRKLARKLVEKQVDPKKKTVLTPADLQNDLGPELFSADEVDDKPQVGVATGLAWTSVGGAILPVEVTRMPGKGDLKLTGSLGDVMKESAQAAFSHLKSRAETHHIPWDIFRKSDFHIHVPDGATPKDGPSAGITIAAALLSLLTDRPVRPGIAMTGEINLRGRITQVGGIKEKIIAAHRAGIREIILPEKNRKDLKELPPEVMKKMQFHPVTEFVEAIPLLLAIPPAGISKSRKQKRRHTNLKA